MKHLGDITQIRGYDIDPVDVITGGSPCQDLSIAGARKGLAGERSGLFMHQIRIIKEMREASKKSGRSGESVQCRWAIWENVPGSFSSNKGRDFQAVLTEFVRVSEPDAPDVPMPAKGKWPKSGWLYDGMGRWSVAWKQHDAQFWGVPQRRKRIALVADFNGLSAPAVLFDPQYRRETEGTDADETEPDSGGERGSEVQALSPRLSGHSQQSGAPGKGTSEGTQGGFRSADRSDGTDGTSDSIGRTPTGSGNCEEEDAGKTGAISSQERAGKPGGGKGILIQGERVGALSTLNNQSVLTTGDSGVHGGGQGSKAGGLGYHEEVSPSLKSVPSGGNTVPDVVHSVHQNASGEVRESDVSYTVGTNQNASGRNAPLVRSVALRLDNGSAPPVGGVELSPTIRRGAGPNGCANVAVASVDCRNGTENENTNVTLQAKPNGGFSLNCGIVIREKKE